MTGLPLFDAPPAVDALEKHPLPEAVSDDLRRALAYFTEHRLPFSAESIRERLSPTSRAVLEQPEHVNALGGWFQGLARGRSPKIRAKGWVDSQRRDARGRPLRMWEAA